MNKRELINKIEQLPSNLIDKKVVISKDNVVELVKQLDGVVELVKQLDEHTKVKVPQCVAECIVARKGCGNSLIEAIEYLDEFDFPEVYDWIDRNSESFARAWIDGYEVEQEKKYTVKIVGTGQYLDERYKTKGFAFIDSKDPLLFTESELYEAGFGGVFENPMFEVEEVE